MSKDNQFKGFALAAFGKMLKAAEPHIHSDAVDLGSEEAQHAMLQALARAAYDLVYHVASHVSETQAAMLGADMLTSHEIVENVPDLPVLPEEDAE